MPKHQYKLDRVIEECIDRFFSSFGMITSNPVPDRLKTHMDIAFDNDDPWGEVQIDLYIGRFVTAMYCPYPIIDVVDSKNEKANLICVARCTENGITFIRQTRPIDAWENAPGIAKALVTHTINVLYNELER